MTAIALSLLAAIGFGTAPIFTRTALHSFSFLPAVWMSLVVSFFLAATLALVFARQDIGNLSLVAFLWILAVALTHHICGRPQNYLSVSIIGASRASLFFSSQAPVAALVAVIFLGESLSTLVIVIGTVAVVAGLVAGSGDSLLEGWRTDRRYLFGYVVALSAGTAYGMVNIFVKKANETLESPLLVTSISLLIGILVLSPLVAQRTAGEVRSHGRPLGKLQGRGAGWAGRRNWGQLAVLRAARRRRGHCYSHRIHRSPGDCSDSPHLLLQARKSDPAAGRRHNAGRRRRSSGVAGRPNMTAIVGAP